MKKLAVAIIIISMAIGLVSYSYAWTSGNCFDNSVCAVKFTKAITSDNEVNNDFAHVSALIIDCGQAIEMTITNGYPGYKAYLTCAIQNKGALPIEATSLTITNPHPEALGITSMDLKGIWLQPGQTIQDKTTVTLLEAAQQGGYYTFKVAMGFTCKTNYPRSKGFWQQELSSALCGTGEEHSIPASTLESYLNQITAASHIFCFTGTRQSKFKTALSILNPSNPSSMEAKLKAQLLALWLNYVAGWTSSCTIDGKTALQTISGSENVLVNHRSSQYEYWKNLCESFNTSWDS
jgi:hypothetical protein